MSKFQYILALLFLFVMIKESVGGIIPQSDIGPANSLLNKRGNGGYDYDKHVNKRKRQASTPDVATSPNPTDSATT
ncbi:22517_t:CDS:1, partial [Gigaspora margarita]